MTVAAQPAVLAAFREYLDSTDLSATSRKSLMSALRRAVRDLGASDMTNAETLAEYRLTMKVGTRNVFDTMWKHLGTMFAPHGITLAQSERLSRLRFAHPLYSSVTLLGAVADYDNLSGMTWGDFAHSPHAQDTRIVGAAMRVWHFQTFDPAAIVLPEPTALDPLLPTGPEVDRSSLRPWRVRSIVNSRQHASDRRHIVAFGELVEGLCWGGITGGALRGVVDPILADRDAFLRSKTALDAVEAALVPAKRGDVGAALHILHHRLRVER
jgi:hypothetical protein